MKQKDYHCGGDVCRRGAEKYDKESNTRDPKGFWGILISAVCILFAVFQLYTAIFGVLDAHLQRTIHLAFGLCLISCFTRPGNPGPGRR